MATTISPVRPARSGAISRTLLAIGLTAGVVAISAPTAGAGPPARADVIDQDGAAVVAPDGARLVRQPNGLALRATMPGPVPGAYVYPAGVEPGAPEVFTLWAFVFNHPEFRTDPCGSDDTTDPDVEFGAYNVAGHVHAGGSLVLSGHVAVDAPAGAPPGVTPHPLSNPTGAEVHLAITSHGGLDPTTLPGEFRSPTGSPVCGCWWTAVFD